MTAPTRYTREEMAAAVSDCALEARRQADLYAGYPRHHQRHIDDAEILEAAATALRQAEEGQGEARCFVCDLKAGECECVPYGAAAPTDPTPPVKEPR